MHDIYTILVGPINLLSQHAKLKALKRAWAKTSSLVETTSIRSQREALNESKLRCTWRWMRGDQGTPGMQRPPTPHGASPAGQMDLSAFCSLKRPKTTLKRKRAQQICFTGDGRRFSRHFLSLNTQ